MSRNYFLIIFIIALTPGCQSTFGPNALQNTHTAYNQSMADTLSQQMLLNIVRLKYRDQINFLKVSSITAALTYSGSLGFDTELDLSPGGNIVKPSFGMSYSDKPTISYVPLQGSDFVKSVFTPISLPALLIMSQSGWNTERIFGLSVERMNNLYNAPTASGPSPEFAPKYQEFKHMLSLFHKIQHHGEMEFGINVEPNSKRKILYVRFKSNQTLEEDINKLTKALGLSSEDKQSKVFKITRNFLSHNKDELTIRTRSIVSIMFYLSQNIDAPQEHIKSGLVTITKTKSGKPFDWNKTSAGTLFKIRSSKNFPENAFLAVPYRNYWYYIADNDLESKSTFMLLMQLYGFQAGQSSSAGPTLTLPVR